MLSELTLENAMITHRDNVPWVLDNGLHCRNSIKQDPAFVNIGSVDLIDKRSRQSVPVAPGGKLSDYVPFYFTPRSIMALNIHTGYNNVRKRPGSDIVILYSTLRQLKKHGALFLFTDRHASTAGAQFLSDLADLDQIDWDILQRSDFSRDNEDIGKTGRYQAEALVHNYMPLDALLGIACYDAEQKLSIESLITKRKMDLKVIRRRVWYF